jgi:hypothetical protein
MQPVNRKSGKDVKVLKFRTEDRDRSRRNRPQRDGVRVLNITNYDREDYDSE